MNRVAALGIVLLFAGGLAFGQGATGTITGIVTDPTGAVIAGASVEMRNVATGQVYTGASSVTGNFAIAQLPTGDYTFTVKNQGFKTFSHPNLHLEAEATLRQDAALEVGTANETVTITAEASLLKTESGELATNVAVENLDNLPILGIGPVNASPYGLRNPWNMMAFVGGVGSYVNSATMVINGLGGLDNLTEEMRIEGQDFTNHLDNFGTQQNAPSVDAIEEVAIQTSNYAPEFGTAGAAVLNVTMKSGTNAFHGSAYDYFVNEDLNAGDPFSISGGPRQQPRRRFGQVPAAKSPQRLWRHVRRADLDSKGLQRPQQDLLLCQFRAVQGDLWVVLRSDGSAAIYEHRRLFLNLSQRDLQPVRNLWHSGRRARHRRRRRRIRWAGRCWRTRSTIPAPAA